MYVRAGWWRLWKEARFEVHGERIEELSMTILFAQIFHSSALSVYMETFCELSSPIHNFVDRAMVAEETLHPRKESNLFSSGT